MTNLFRYVQSFLPTFVAGCAILFALSTQGAEAQTCAPTYSGCTTCGYAQSTTAYVPGAGYQSVFVSGSEWHCWSNASTRYPIAAILANNPYYGMVSVTCQAQTALVPQPSTAPAQPSDPNLRNVYRFFWNSSKDHLLTLDWCEGQAFATYEHVAFKTLVTPLDSNMHQLYRCYWSGASDHLVSPDPNCEGLTYEGSYGYVSSIPRDGYVPLYRYYMPSWKNHLSTTNSAEAASGWVYEGIQGYVPQ